MVRNICDSVLPSHAPFTSYLWGNFINSFFFSPVLANDVFNVINSFVNKSSSKETYPIKVLKFISHCVSPIIFYIINWSFMTGEFPHSEKIARVVQIFTNGEVSDPSKYRPISILPLLGKIIERIVYRQVYPYLEKNGILTSEQYGFRCGKTTSDAFVNFSNYVYGELDRGNYVFSLFLDFKKAFDSVSH